ncbi:MAG: Uma2 family endonuclease [Thermoanaerobaculia bacterium]
MNPSPALRFTYQDYLLLPEERRYEILDGDLFMTPAPTTRHQRVSLKLTMLLSEFVRTRKLGEVLYAPCDVVLSEMDVLQPDILFVSRERSSIIGEKFISAAPDLVVEILSPSTADRDRGLKAKVYARFGVRELWIVDPEAETVTLLTGAEAGFAAAGTYRPGQTLRSRVLEGLEIPIAEIF